MNSTRPHLTPTYSMKLPQRLIQEQDRRQNQSKRARASDCRVDSISTTKGAIKTRTPDLGQLSHKKHPTDNTGGIEVSGGRKSEYFFGNSWTSPTPPSSIVSGQTRQLWHGGDRCCCGAFSIVCAQGTRRRRLHLRSACNPGLLPPGKTHSCAACQKRASRCQSHAHPPVSTL